jgi:hypothetical protein
MNFKEIRKEVSTILNSFFDSYGFKIDNTYNDGLRIVKNTEDVMCIMSTDKLKRSDGIELPFGTENIQFKKIEEIIFPLILKHKLWDTATEPTSYSNSHSSWRSTKVVTGEAKLIQSIHINAVADVVDYCKALEQLFLKYSLPWFERYSKLEEVNDLINELGMQDMLNCFSLPFPTPFYRAMVITEMCNNRARTLEIRDECLRRFADCKKDSFYTPLMIASYEGSLQELCAMYNII